MSDNNVMDSVVNPVLIVDNYQQGRLRYIMNLDIADSMMSNPDVWGAVLFDLTLNIATVYAQVRNLDIADVHKSITQKMESETAIWRNNPGHSAPKITMISKSRPN